MIHQPFRAGLLANAIRFSLLGLMGASPLLVTGVAQAQAESRHYEIAAGSLSEVLSRFAGAAGAAISFDSRLIAGRQSAGLHGQYSVEQGFAVILAATGFQAVRQGNGSYVLLARSEVGSALELGATSISAASDRLGQTTEHSNAYATGAMSTATKLSLTARQTPQSLTVVTRQQMNDQNLTNLASVLERTTGVTLSKTESDRHYIYARGFAITKLQYDGISTRDNGFGYETDLLSDTSIYDRVEIVRGATGLLSGSGEPSASINLIRKRPTTEFQGHVQGSVGRWDNYRSEMDLSGPLSSDGRIRGRFVGTYADRKSNLDYYGKDATGLYGILETDLSDETLLTLGLDYHNSHASGVTYGAPVPLFHDNGQKAHFSRSTTTAADWTSLDKEKTVAFASLEHRFNDSWQAKLQYTHREIEASPKLLYMYGFPDATTGQGIGAFSTSYHIDTKQDAIDAYTTGLFPLLGRGHELVFGYSYSQYEANYKWHPLLGSAPLDNFYDRDDYPEPVFGKNYNRTRDSKWRETGTYAAVRWNLADSLKFITGLRVTDSDFDEAYSTSTTKTSASYSSELTPYAGLVYDITDNHSVYVSYTDIFQTQTNRDRSGTLLDPVTGKNYEAGVKSEFYDGRLNLSAAVFKVKQDNLAEFDTVIDGENRYRAIKGATVRGYELEVSGELTPNWNVSGGFTRRLAMSGDGTSIQTIEPQNLFRLTSAYRLPGNLSSITLGGHASWQSRTYEKDIGPSGEDALQESYELLHLFGIYQASHNLSFQANLNNVFDKVYYSGIVDGYGLYGDPRNLAVSAKYSF
ncbi:TonB-dependent siderophore receptor [Pseudomonas sp. ABC1]|uniref:TonB-dependent siderophore receptor n=1 Tax=Pseudomonas sp. ABC1 TaxID=2748080 RepID=UPI0015C31228|nr:TonB-dependent receptor [Pseudomonas sp. ABC1]QLF92036.1 TonB-dependent siderophore receptor [Pseudomonas sp. ABC1]